MNIQQTIRKVFGEDSAEYDEHCDHASAVLDWAIALVNFVKEQSRSVKAIADAFAFPALLCDSLETNSRYHGVRLTGPTAPREPRVDLRGFLMPGLP